MKKYSFVLMFFLFNLLANAQDFITQWDLSKPGGPNTQLTFGVGTVGTCSYTWETIPAGATGNGTFSGNTITITGLPAGAMIRLLIDTTNFRRVHIKYGIDKNRLKDIEQWGDVHWNNMDSAFAGCQNLNITSIDTPDLSGVFTLNAMFKNCVALNGPSNIGSWNVSNVNDMRSVFDGAKVFNQSVDSWNTSGVINMYRLFFGTDSFNQPLSNWDVSNVVDMSSLFFDAGSFNQPLGNWNTSNVIDMNYMFADATSFNQPIGNWNTSNVTLMYNMFGNATAFNQALGNWNTSNVTNMRFMFCYATSFNQPIGNWNTSNVTDMEFMFSGASVFNQTIGNWNTSNVTNMTSMFEDAPSFNQPIANWNISQVTGMSFMFYYATSFNQAIGNWQLNQNVNLNVMLSHSGMDCSTYSTTLNGWSNNPNIPVNRQLAASNLTFGLNIQNDRNYLINTKGWTISGDTMNNVNCCVSSFYTYNASACNSYFFNGQSLVNSGTYYDTLVNANGCDSLLTLNLTINQNGFTINDSACISYSFNGLIISSSGTYFDTLVNMNGCDSLITLNLTINTVNSTVTQSAANLSANASGATYQWLTCNPFQEIIGETSQNFIASNNGDYAVVVSQNGCTDTSSCYVVIGIGYNNFDLSNNIKIFPNPFNQVLQIETEHVLQNAEIKLLNTLGQSIATFSHISDKTYTTDLSALAPGSYFIQIKDAKHNFVQKLRKE